MTRHLCVGALFVLPLLSLAADYSTALDALKVLPKIEWQNLARIEGYDGTPDPERWHFLVFDPSATTGLREYVVSEGELVAVRAVSQFAESLTGADVIGDRSLEIDSDQVAQIAKQYATANKVKIAGVSYHLQKGTGIPEPVWRVNCTSAEGKPLGSLVVTTLGGNVVSHDGFAVQPKTDLTGKTGRLAAMKSKQEAEETGEKKRSRSSTAKSRSKSESVAGKVQKKATASGNRDRSEKRSRSGISGDSTVNAAPKISGDPLGSVAVRKPSGPLGGLFRKVFR